MAKYRKKAVSIEKYKTLSIKEKKGYLTYEEIMDALEEVELIQMI